MMATKTVNLKEIPLLDYSACPQASDIILPKAGARSNQLHLHGWHFEVQQQPPHDTGNHCHQMHILTMITSGTAIDQSIDGRFQPNSIGQNNAFILPAGVLHRCEWRQDIEFMFVAIDPQIIVQVGQEIVNSDRIELIPHFATIQDPLIQGILLALKQELITQNINSNLFVEQLKTTLVAHLLRSYGTQKVQIATYTDGLPRHKLNRVLDYIEAHLECNLELKEIAQQTGMSQFYFSRLFKQSLKITPHQYVIQQRVERAKQLLQKNEMNLAEIALECGFADQNHFSKIFRQKTGISPKAYRER